MTGEVGRRLSALREAGAERFDGPGFRFIEGLLRRAESLQGRAAARLLDRAGARLGALEAAFAAARTEATAALDEAGEDAPEAAREAFANGDLRAARRLASRSGALAQSRAARVRLDRLAREAETRGVRLPDPVRRALDEDATEDPRHDRRLGDDVARLLFRDAAEHARSAVVVARAADAVPDQVGPYNARALTARALGLAESLSPAYLRALLDSVEDLSALLALPEPPAPRRHTRRR